VCGWKPKAYGWNPKGSRHARGYDSAWARLQARKLRDQPLCEKCLVDGITIEATTVDHIVPFKGKGDPMRLRYSNLMSLCKTHHARKSVEDRLGERGAKSLATQ